MTKLLEQAVEAARNLPPDAQDDIAHVVLRLAGTDDEPPVQLTPDEQTAIAASKVRDIEPEARCPAVDIRSFWHAAWRGGEGICEPSHSNCSLPGDVRNGAKPEAADLEQSFRSAPITAI